MNKSIPCLAALLIAAPTFAGEPRIHTTRDSGGYEATLRQAGIPLAGGLAWSARPSTPLLNTGHPVETIRAATSPAIKAS